MLSRPSRTRYVRQASIIGAVILGLAILAGLVVMAARAQTEARNATQAQLEVQKLHAAVSRTQVMMANAIVDAYADPSVENRARVKNDAWRRGLSEWGAVRAANERLRELAPGPATDRISQTIGLIYRQAAATVTAPVTERVNRSTAERLSALAPGLSVLAERIADLTVAEQHRGAAASRRARNAFILAVTGGVLLLLGLAALLLRTARRSRLKEQMSAVERRSEERVRALIEHSGDVVAVVDPVDHHVRWVAAAIERLIGLVAADTIGRNLWEVVHEDDVGVFRAGLDRCLGKDGHELIRARMRHRDGRWVWMEAVAEDRSRDEAVEGLLLSIRDVTERKHLEDRLRHQAYHDSLTGLGNRAMLEERLEAALRVAAGSTRSVAVLHLDIDDFKTINDSLGHSAGDELLRAVGGRIASVLDTGAVATRLGADEFAVLVRSARDEQAAIDVAEQILDVLAPPFGIGGRELRISSSVGIVIDDGSTSMTEVLRNADLAMYAAKSHPSRIRVFEQELHDRVVDRLELGGQIERGVEQEQFRLLFQPIVELQDQVIAGMEALVRWDHPERGMLSPDRFIGLAEESGAIIELGRWVLHRACADAVRLTGAGGLGYVSVNVSIKQLELDDFVDQVKEALRVSGLPAGRLVLEITESLLVEDRELAAVQLARLKDLGIRIAVDDFGVGYSILAYLQELPIDLLKIDRSFIDRIHVDDGRAALAEGIVDLAHRLQLEVVAEGIEEAEHAELLRAAGARYGQGYLFSRPVPIVEIEERIGRSHTAPTR